MTQDVPLNPEPLVSLGTVPMAVEPSTVIVGLLVGLGLGILFFGGLWLTVRQIPRSRQPAVLVLLSFVLRMLLVLAGFFLLSRAGWMGPSAGLLGFLAARILLIRWVHGSRPDGLGGLPGRETTGES